MKPDAPLQLLVTNIDFDAFTGRIAIGRVSAGAAIDALVPLPLSLHLLRPVHWIAQCQ